MPRKPKKRKRGICTYCGETKLLVGRSLVGKTILGAIKARFSQPGILEQVFKRVEEKVAELGSEVPQTIRLKEAELQAEERRLANFVEFIAEGRGSKSLAAAMTLAERKMESLGVDLAALRLSRDDVFKAPPLPWIADRVEHLQQVLECRTEKSALLLRNLLGRIRIGPREQNGGGSRIRPHTANNR